MRTGQDRMEWNGTGQQNKIELSNRTEQHRTKQDGEETTTKQTPLDIFTINYHHYHHCCPRYRCH